MVTFHTKIANINKWPKNFDERPHRRGAPKLPLSVGDPGSHLKRGSFSPRVHTPNDMLIGPSVVAQRMVTFNRRTDTQTHRSQNIHNRPHLYSACL